MKASELRDLDELGLDRELAELREELFNLRFQQATRQLTNSQCTTTVTSPGRPKPTTMGMSFFTTAAPLSAIDRRALSQIRRG